MTCSLTELESRLRGRQTRVVSILGWGSEDDLRASIASIENDIFDLDQTHQVH